jgi:hypothetical protein
VIAKPEEEKSRTRKGGRGKETRKARERDKGGVE